MPLNIIYNSDPLVLILITVYNFTINNINYYKKTKNIFF